MSNPNEAVEPIMTPVDTTEVPAPVEEPKVEEPKKVEMKKEEKPSKKKEPKVEAPVVEKKEVKSAPVKKFLNITSNVRVKPSCKTTVGGTEIPAELYSTTSTVVKVMPGKVLIRNRRTQYIVKASDLIVI